jgi:hypothetical protein
MESRKTMLAVGLARAAVEAGYRTYFTTAADLTARCHRAAIEGRWATTTSTSSAIYRCQLRPPPRCSKSSTSATSKTSIVLTTNRPITSWGETLGDTTVAAARGCPGSRRT